MIASPTKTGISLLIVWFLLLRLGRLALQPFRAGFLANGLPIWFFVILAGIHLVGIAGLTLVVYGWLQRWWLPIKSSSQRSVIAMKPNDTLDECINNFGIQPRHFSWWDRLTYLRIPRPSWLRARPTDAIATLFENTGNLFEQGKVVWGCIIQANSQLFEDGRNDCPGEVVYSLSAPMSFDPAYLMKVAQHLGSLKGTQPTHPDLLRIADYLTDELIRVYGLDVPRTLSPEVPCRISTTFFIRKHLPKRRLCRRLIPMIVNPVAPFVALPLPSRYWPTSLIDWWTR